MALGNHRRAVGVFSNYRAAEMALQDLKNSGFPMDRVSIIAKDVDRNNRIADAEVRDVSDARGNKADEGAATGAIAGGTLGGLTGLLVGLGALAIPGIGPVMLAGATATAIATTLSGTAIGAAAGGLLGALIGLGIPEERARVYNERVSRGEYLVIVDGDSDEIARAEAILRRHNIEEWGIYDSDRDIDRDVRREEIHDIDRDRNVVRSDYTNASDAEVIIVDRRDPAVDPRDPVL
ncbi:general stress protein [Floridanema evergladense]|uniref:General stress protein n=1 Tax=Floridaenema evergladense BLCC-F167 TaxID=3153639 RepID=A0ABV4WPX2_9CYAN